MKHAFLLLLYSSALIAQTPVATGGSGLPSIPWYGWVAGMFLAGIVVYFVLKRKRPEIATKIDAGAGTVAHLVSGEAMALLSRAHDTIATQAATISQQATVIASPPVQAAVNAPPPVQITGVVTVPPSRVDLSQPKGAFMPNKPPPSDKQYPGTGRLWWPGDGHGYFYDQAAAATTLPPEIVAATTIPPPEGGWPPYDPNQSSATHKDTDYIHVNPYGGLTGGYYTFPGYAERSYRPLPVPTTPNPYDGNGLTAAIMVVTLGTNATIWANADAALQAALGPAGPNTAYAQCVNINGEADPTWNGALYGIVTGKSVDEAWAGVQKGQGGLYNDPAFTRAQLEGAAGVINGWR